MLTMNVAYHLKPGHRDAFYQALGQLGVRALSRTEAGNTAYDYYFSAEDPDVLLLVETWADARCQEAHTKTDTFAALQALKAQHCARVTVDKFEH